MMACNLYQRHYIPQSTKSIRLLRLKECIYAMPSDKGLPKALQCSFEVHDLDKAPKCVALSYTWSSQNVVDGVLTIDEQTWLLQENLCAAMLHIWDEKGRIRDDYPNVVEQKQKKRGDWRDFVANSRREMVGFSEDETESRTKPLIWIDYICINQANVNERNHQVSLMSAIYSNAKTVVVWLGKESDDTRCIVEFIRQISPGDISNTEKFLKLLEKLEKSRELSSATKALLNREYWSRMWIVQEVLLAKRLLIFVGRSSLIMDAKREWQITTLHWILLAESLQSTQSERFTSLSIIKAILQSPANYRNLKADAINELMDTWAAQDCTDRRDKVFALLGLTDGSEDWPKADYSLSEAQIYSKFVLKFATITDRHSVWKNFALKLAEILGVDAKNEVVEEADIEGSKLYHEKFPNNIKEVDGNLFYGSDAESTKAMHNEDTRASDSE